ncbi:MAG: tetratricopeptide repeat protein [Spirochaetia bacterium]|nr:tetratricopeptide repeat protein [Spirochaetia bacterium]
MDSQELLMKGADALAEDNLKEAESLFLLAAEADDSNYLAFYNLGTIFFRRKDYRKAKEFYRKALDINPDYQVARENIALANFYLAMLA